MEEVGLLGARQIAYSLKPDVALVVDVTHATDYPTVSQQQHGDVKIGQRPGAHARRLQPSRSRRAPRSSGQGAKNQVATRGHVQHQRHGHRRDFLDARRHPSALISLPNRYMHSPVEVVSLKDLEQIPQLLGAFARSLKKGEEFKVKI